METYIRLRDLTKQFPATPGTDGGPVTAVDGIDLDINAGEIVALLGPNGAGKTSTLDMILGFTVPTSGQVTVFDTDPRNAVAAGRISAVLQTGGLLRDLRVGETIDLVASTYGPKVITSTDRDRIIKQAGLGPLLDRMVQACSGGEQQRLRFALALLANPDLLLLDEPTTGMDVQARRDVWAALAAPTPRRWLRTGMPRPKASKSGLPCFTLDIVV